MTKFHQDDDTRIQHNDQPDREVVNVATTEYVPAAKNHVDDLEQKIRNKILSSNHSTEQNNTASGTPTCAMVSLHNINRLLHGGDAGEQSTTRSDRVTTEMYDVESDCFTISPKKCTIAKTIDEQYIDIIKELDCDIEKLDPEFAGLAVAVAITEVELSDDLFLPAAIEFDPETKKIEEEKSNRMSRRKIIIGIILIAVVVNSITFGIVLGTKKSTTTAAAAAQIPLHPRMQIGILQFLESNFPSDVHHFRDSNHPLTKAMNWMTLYDPQLLVPSQNKTFLQRFVLVHLYFQTTQNNNWAYCHPNGTTAKAIMNNTLTFNDTTARATENCFIFTESKYSPLAQGKAIPKIWLSKQDVCDWHTNNCDSSGHITKLSPVGLGLNGPFPDKLNRLSFLKKVEITANNITGTIPDSVHFKYLNAMDAGNNQLTGEFPVNFYQQSRLLHRYIYHYNQFTKLNIDDWPTDIKYAMFDGSNFSQVLLDTHIARISSISAIDLANTKLKGKIPLSLWNLSYITNIELSRNFLTGKLPQQQIPIYLSYLKLEGNQITGPLPEESFSSSHNLLETLFLSENKLEGTIPENIYNLQLLYEISLEKNKGLYGTLPTEFGTLLRLNRATFDGTKLNGTVPTAICNLRGSTGLQTLSSNCLIDTMTGTSQISCADGCCTSCCDFDGSNCIDYV